MASSDMRSNLEEALSFLRRSGHAIAVAVGKWLIVFVVVWESLRYLTDAGSDVPKRLAALLALSFLGISLAYWVYVSRRVSIEVPGIDVRAMEPQEEKKPRSLRDALPWHKAWTTMPGTFEVSRLSTKATGVTIANDSTLPVMRAEAMLAIVSEAQAADGSKAWEAGRNQSVSFSLSARGSRHVATASTFEHVGVFLLRSTGVRVWDLIGLLSRLCGTRGQWRVRVVPNIYRLAQGIPRSRNVLQSSLGIPDTPTDALDYDRVREYRPRDPLKKIHWKLVAHRQGELYTKLFETSTTSEVVLVIDPYGPDYGTGYGTATSDAAYHMHDTMLEGGFSLLEHAREQGIQGRVCFVNKGGSLIDAPWRGPTMLGWFVEAAQRPSHTIDALERSIMSLRTLETGRVGYAIFATSCLSDRSTRELIACHRAGIPLLVVHAHSSASSSDAGSSRQRSYDEHLRRTMIDVIALTDGPQIITEVSAS